MDFLEVAAYLLANAASFVPDMSTCFIVGEAKDPRAQELVQKLGHCFAVSCS